MKAMIIATFLVLAGLATAWGVWFKRAHISINVNGKTYWLRIVPSGKQLISFKWP